MIRFSHRFLLALTGVVLAGAAPARRPNILIAVTDDWSFPHASAYGTRWVSHHLGP